MQRARPKHNHGQGSGPLMPQGTYCRAPSRAGTAHWAARARPELADSSHAASSHCIVRLQRFLALVMKYH